MPQKPFFHSCVGWPIDVRVLDWIKDNAEDIEWDEFIANVELHPGGGLYKLLKPMEWGCWYYKTGPIYFAQHSAIEYVFADDDDLIWAEQQTWKEEYKSYEHPDPIESVTGELIGMTIAEAAIKSIVHDHTLGTGWTMGEWHERTLRNVAIPKDYQLITYHVTDDPERLVSTLRSGVPVSKVLTHGDIGFGVYFSAIPELWRVRSKAKWEIFETYDRDRRKRLVLAAGSEMDRRQRSGYLTTHEYGRFKYSLQKYLETGDVSYLADVSGQPYNMTFDKKLTDKAGTPAPKEPAILKAHLEGDFIDLTNIHSKLEIPCKQHLVELGYMRYENGRYEANDRMDALLDGWVGWTNAVALSLKELGFDGAFERQGFNTTAQIVVWNNKAIKSLDGYEQ